MSDYNEERARLIAEARELVDRPEYATDEQAETRYKVLFSQLKELDTREEARKAREPVDSIVRPRDYRGAPSSSKAWLPSMQEYRVALAEASGATGGILVADQQANTFFDLLRAKSVVLQAEPRIVTMTGDVCKVPKILTSTTTAFYNENAALSSTEMTFETVTLTARKIAAYCLVSNELLTDSSPDLRQVAGYDFAQAMATGLDAAFLAGDGSAPNPRGIRNFTSVTETAADTNGAAPTMSLLLAQVGRLEVLNANIERCAWFMHPRSWAHIKALLTDEGDYYLNPNPSGPFARSIFGIPVYVSTQMSVTEAEGGSGAICSSIILADMDQIVVGRRQEIELKYSEHIAFDQDATALRATARFDIQPINVKGVDILKGVLA